jgi:DNA-binding XRE family transcriptional regulator
MLTGEQIRGGRAIARMEQSELARAAKVSLETVKRLEKTRGPISANTGTETAIRRALGEAGVIFIDENGEGPGVRLRKNRPARAY